MKCEICKGNEATVHFKQVVNGEAREMHVCAGCAAEHGLDLESPLSVTEFLFGMGSPRDKAVPKDTKKCPACGLKARDYKKRQRLGCPSCYATFADELEPVLGAMHKGNHHEGKVPARFKVTAEIGALEKALRDAVARQDFEEAATLRDRIGDLKRKQDAGAAGGARP